MEDVGAEVRSLLPQATYLTDSAERPEGFFYPSNEQLVGWMNQAAVSIALARSGGSCVPTMQSLLCGTPVVSVPNVGGRDRFLREPFALTVAPTAEAVAAGVAELKSRGLSRRDVHEAARAMLVEARARFLDDVHATMRELFGSTARIEDLSGLVGNACRYRRCVDALPMPGAAPARDPSAGDEPAAAVDAPAIRSPISVEVPPRTFLARIRAAIAGWVSADETVGPRG
jgi:hypothetical protein